MYRQDEGNLHTIFSKFSIGAQSRLGRGCVRDRGRDTRLFSKYADRIEGTCIPDTQGSHQKRRVKDV